MTTIAVDPAVYEAASEVFGIDLADRVDAGARKLVADLHAKTRAAGGDPAGQAWAEHYDVAARRLLDSVDDLRRASVTVGLLLQQSGFNHARAEAHSDVSGQVPMPPDSTDYDPSTKVHLDLPTVAGGDLDVPNEWKRVQELIEAIWPDGNGDKLRAIGRAWRAFANELDSSQQFVTDGIATIQTQVSPEIEAATMVCRSLGTQMHTISDACRQISTAADELAEHIDQAHMQLFEQLTQLLMLSIVIEGAGAAISTVAGGEAELAAQGLEAGAIARVIGAIQRILDALEIAIGQIVTRLALGALDVATTALKAILDKIPLVADTTAVSAGTKVLNALATTFKLGGSRVVTEADFDAWKATLPTRSAKFGSDGARTFQKNETGSDTELQLSTADGTTTIWADGLKYEQKTGGVAVEAKFVDNPAKSIYEGKAPDFITDSALGGKDGFDAEMYKYATVLNDAGNPVNRLDVVVSTQAAKDFLGSRLSQLADKFAAEGLKFPYRIEVGT